MLESEFANLPQQAVGVDNEFLNKLENSVQHHQPKSSTSTVSPFDDVSPFDSKTQLEHKHKLEPSFNPPVEKEPSPKSDIILPPKLKYHIIDCYWLVNHNLYNNKQLPNNEPGIITIGYNATFNNMRVSFYGLTDRSFTDTAIILNNCKRLTSVNLFSETIDEISYTIKERQLPHSINLVERLWNKQPSWAPNKTQLEVGDQYIKLSTVDNGTKTPYSYVFTKWQYNCLINVMKMMINGTFWKLSMESTFYKE